MLRCAYAQSPVGVGRPIFLPKKLFTMDFYLYGAILNLKAFCFGVIPDIIIELIVWECATKQAVIPPSGPK